MINKKRENKMCFISEHEYIKFPLTINSKIYNYCTINNNRNQMIFSICAKSR